MPLLTVALVALLSPVPPQHGAGPMAAAVWLPGFGAALSSIGFGAIIAFNSLLPRNADGAQSGSCSPLSGYRWSRHV
jgi:hypothetical protein